VYRDLLGWVVGKGSLASLQSLVGVLAGLTSIGGAVYSAVQYAGGNGIGDLTAIVRTVDGDAPAAGAIVEVLTIENALVTSLTAAKDGQASTSITEGRYVVRASAPAHEPETRAVEIQRGGRSQIRFALAPRTPPTVASIKDRPTSGTARAVDKSAGAVKRLFRGLGL
jgi:hypothetical protein